MNYMISKVIRQLSAHWGKRHWQLGPTYYSQSPHAANTIAISSPAILPLPKEFSGISNPPPMFDCILAAAAALAVMINWLATWTRIGPMIVLTLNHKVVVTAFSATELSRGNRECMIPLLCQLSKPNTSPAPKAPIKRNGYSSSTEIYPAKTHYRSQSIATVRVHLVISQLES